VKSVFADAVYWIAVANPRDRHHASAKAAHERLGKVRLVTTDEILSEFVTLLAKFGPEFRRRAALTVRAVLENPNIDVVPQSRQSFLGALTRYESREDKKYSLQDCVAMDVMESRGITEVLTNDRHFAQEGFVVLIDGDRY
jgi:predicted nucleic acid-binding protein